MYLYLHYIFKAYMITVYIICFTFVFDPAANHQQGV